MRTSRRERISRGSRRNLVDDKDKLEEVLDSNGDVKRVADLTFDHGILGKGSYGTVRLARRPVRSRKQVDPPSEPPPPSNMLLKSASVRNLLSVAKDIMGMSRRLLNVTNDDDEQEEEELVAVKIFRKSTLKRTKSFERSKASRRMLVKTAWMNVEREIAICKKLSHPNLVKLHEVLSPESDMLYMVLEYCQLGEILTFQTQDKMFRREGSTEGMNMVDGHFQPDTAALFMVDILHGLAYLHDNHIAHRDLKPENILISQTPAGVPIAKLSDFGVAHMFENQEQSSCNADDAALSPQELVHKYSQRALSNVSNCQDTVTSTEGTMVFWSPEMCQGRKEFSAFSADVWAAGVCFYIFVSGRLPFFDELEIDLIEKIANSDVPLDSLGGVCDSLMSLLRTVLNPDPTKRATVGDCLQHPFLKEASAARMLHLSNKCEKGSA
ncbi:activated protein kinase catalytic subunit alpha-1 [Seminavis robusta]|uniref:Activated protein kinase catalytic subunit alpha-1 n=1 Tax=Seminavis robusta TaxID=568900 RepID=A0A9N8ETU9_9STRA|nr:activated protein kinase catalytic subunit alpha-1 [Seminavis robusta]|eukprot:Sro1857_g302050.1 activated protein kinase catalytic subunit alpha-1 (439) ;mRNA; f:11693-13009